MKWIKKVATTPISDGGKVVNDITQTVNDTVNAPSIKATRDAIANMWQVAYPIGSVYMSVADVNPDTIFGGTWDRIQNRFLLASSTTYPVNSTGGEATHTLTTSELPSHTHGFSVDRPTDTGSIKGYLVDQAGGTAFAWETTVGSGTTDATGGGGAHNNMPPYIAVNVWVRIA